jgi:GTP pyrophosphokinase
VTQVGQAGADTVSPADPGSAPTETPEGVSEATTSLPRPLVAPPTPFQMLPRTASGPEQPRLRLRDRIARWAAPSAPQSAVLEPLFNVVRQNHPKADLALIERAYRTAEHYHAGQTRKSGDAYITHPLAVTTILAELGMTEPTLVAALLHDTVEDTSYTMAQLRADFGAEVAALVDGVTKLEKVHYGDHAKAESIRKMVIAMSRDIRVLVIKLADRLHNMRTLGFLRPDKQNRIAKETLEIFAPLANRLGMNAIKWELEDLAFSTMHPKMYDEIVHLVADNQPRRERYLDEIIAEVTRDLAASKITATVYGRPKHYWSIYQKMVVRGREFSDIHDLLGLRIIVGTKSECYEALGLIHLRWLPVQGRFKDYIALPKFNMYQSLHTTVLGPGGRPVEFQIRTQEMHRRAEYGVAAHWKYKEAPNAKSGPLRSDGQDLPWVNHLDTFQAETSDPNEFLDSLMFEINASEVYVFTPKGDIVALSQGATPVDFAYAVHTEVGHRCVGARVNGRLVSLETALETGDVVDVLTSKSPDSGPSRDWLNFVTSPRARQKIRQYFTRERRDASMEQGKDLLAKQLRKAGQPIQRLVTQERMAEIAAEFKVADVPGLYVAIGESQVSAQNVVEHLLARQSTAHTIEEQFDEREVTRTRTRTRTGNATGIEVSGDPSMWVKLARCCTPVPGDDILGFVTRGQGVSVHRRDCTNAAGLLATPERIVDVAWSVAAGTAFLVGLYVEGIDRAGLLSDVTQLLAEEKISIQSASIKTSKDRIFRGTLTFETADPMHLNHVITRLLSIPALYEVKRVSA